LKFTRTIAAAAALSIGTLGFAGSAEAGHWHHHHRDAVAAGFVGLAAGALIGSALARPQQPRGFVVVEPSYGYSDWIAYCSQRYRSFDPRTGLYFGYDGYYHECR
jgi:hypothetical protein